MADEYVKVPQGDPDDLKNDLTDKTNEMWLERVLGDIQWAEDFYAPRNREMATYAKWYYKQHYDTSLLDSINHGLALSGEAEGSQPSGSDDEHLTVINIPTNVIDTAITVLLNEFPHIEVLSAKDSSTATRKQTSVERMLVGAYYINQMIQGLDPVWDAALNQLVYGWGCLRVLWDIDRERMLEKYDDGYVPDYCFPLVIQSISPFDVYPLPFGKYERWRGVFYKTMRPREEVEEEWNVTIDPPTDENGDPIEGFDTSMVDFVDYWCWEGTDIYHCVLADNHFVKEPTLMEEYDSLPYEIFFCREGPDKSRGDTMGLSFLYTLLEAVRELEMLANREHRAIDMYADPVVVVTKQPSSPSVEIETGPGSVIEIESGESVNYLQWAGSAPDTRYVKDFWQKLSQEFSFPAIFSGIVGGTSGLDTIALQQGGMTKVFTPRQNLEKALERVNTKIIRLFQKRRPTEPLHVRGIRTESDEEMTFAFNIRGKDTKGYEYTKVTVRAKFPQEELRNAAIAQGLVAADLYSARDVMSKFLYVQDPERMKRRRDEEKAQADPAWYTYHIQRLLSLPPQSEAGQALVEGGDAATTVQTEPSEPPPGDATGGGLLGPEGEALNTIAGAGEVRPQTTDNPLTAIMAQARQYAQ